MSILSVHFFYRRYVGPHAKRCEAFLFKDCMFFSIYNCFRGRQNFITINLCNIRRIITPQLDFER